MPSFGRLVAVLAITLFAGLILMFPARVAYHWLAPAEMELAGVTGTVWIGASRHASIAGVYVANLQWRIRPLALIKGQLTYRLRGAVAGGTLDADLALTFAGNVVVSGAQAAVSLEALAGIAGRRGLAGIASADIESLTVRDGVLTQASGIIDVRELRLPEFGTQALGDYRAIISSTDDGIVAMVSDVNGVVSLDGRFLLRANGQYQFLGTLLPKTQTPQYIRDQMRFLGSPGDDGAYEFRFEGVLNTGL